MATFYPICEFCEGEITKLIDLDDNAYWVHRHVTQCRYDVRYPKLKPALNQIMEFEHIIKVNDDGSVMPVPLLSPYFELNVDTDGNDEFYIPEGWELLTGFTGQYGYRGPVMHSSEFIGGGLETHILETPGYYVALVVNGYCHYDGTTDCNEDSGCDCEPAGWAVAYKPFGGANNG